MAFDQNRGTDMKNYPVEFFRFFFMLFICLTHFPGKAVIHLEHAYLATDWFLCFQVCLYTNPLARQTLSPLLIIL